MKVSFIGTSNAAVCVAANLKSKGFDVVSVYSPYIKTAVDAAIRINCKARWNLERTVSEGEAVFITVSEKSTKQILHDIYKLKPRDKVFCFLSQIETSDIAMLGSSNTCFSFAVMANINKKEIVDLSDVQANIEGSGPKYWDFIDELNEKGLFYKVITKETKCAYALSVEMVTELVSALLSTASDILENAGITDKKFLKGLVYDNINTYFLSPKELSYFDTPLLTGSVASINRHFDALDMYAGASARFIYKTLAFNVIEHSGLKKSEIARLKKLILDKK